MPPKQFFSHAPASQDEKTLYGLSKVLGTLQAINRSMTIEAANVFLLVALKEGQKAVDLCRETGLSQSTMSRNLIDLSEYRRDLSEGSETGRKEGYGLVVGKVDPMELRSKHYHLTPKGRGLRDRLVQLLSQG